ncbi:secretoglobin family 1D member 2-like [Saccopteryx bilineata]|uniref:secretoglobin family 1D member 2-like n=1 Tax=Saccopteryx bilineata TaxID=59482 RepID=UPI00338D99BA
MKPVLCVLLVTLAFSCYEANVLICPAVLSHVRSLFLDSDSAFSEEIQRYDAPPEAVVANMEVKKCMDQISSKYKRKILSYVVQTEYACNGRI